MDLNSVTSEFEEAVAVQLQLAGDDPAIEAAGTTLLTALEPALYRAMMTLVEQAADEVGAQLLEQTVDVVMSEGRPSLVVRWTEPSVKVNTDDLGARVTVRLPNALKVQLEGAAGEVGDSVNSYIVKTLSSRSGRRRSGRRITGTFKT